jgi:hypothetical protein
MKRKVMLAVASMALAGGFGVATMPVAHADGCGNAGSYGSCDFNFAPDGSHEHCDRGFAPFVGYINNCFWVNTHP